ncbi:MAG: FEKKY domain-containing protein [Bacteroidia bacterium]
MKTQRRYKKIYFYTAGLQAYDESKGSCRDIQAAKMSFGYRRKAGCVVGPIKYARIHAHNNKVEKKLKKRFGDNWREQYEKLLVDCKNAS